MDSIDEAFGSLSDAVATQNTVLSAVLDRLERVEAKVKEPQLSSYGRLEGALCDRSAPLNIREVETVEALYATLVAVHPELTDPRCVDTQVDRVGVEDETVTAPVLFDKLVALWLKADFELAVRGKAVDVPVSETFTIVQDRDGHVRGRMVAVVDNEHGVPFLIDFNDPLVINLVNRCGQRSLGDRVRVQAYLVRVLGVLVGRPGFTVRLLAQYVGVLRRLCSYIGLSDRDECGDEAKTTGDGADDRGDVLNAHASDSTEPIQNKTAGA